jgi:hypothetical protein
LTEKIFDVAKIIISDRRWPKLGFSLNWRVWDRVCLLSQKFFEKFGIECTRCRLSDTRQIGLVESGGSTRIVHEVLLVGRLRF